MDLSIYKYMDSFDQMKVLYFLEEPKSVAEIRKHLGKYPVKYLNGLLEQNLVEKITLDKKVHWQSKCEIMEQPDPENKEITVVIEDTDIHDGHGNILAISKKIPREVKRETIQCKDEKDVAEKIHILLIDKKFRKKAIQKGLEHSKKFTWKKCIEETMGVYEKLC